ncbi:biliverdin-producing heme oxygenase [Xylophilus ampelinus]|uniref:biliverdin-producing heme oxygenase n=1 Tax=Xylophilus ampelinus TaxID=54067 RepID=UPI000D7CD123|nr:biliverdin-producing heme oxygenase [Xylophilus ampelinus]MCS4509453.1 biliverdin-producing heme oxygenase [Xylophilus ampelinus]
MTPSDSVAAAADPVAALRAATHGIHQQLDSALPLAAPDASLPDYVRHLQAVTWWLGALAPVWTTVGVPAEWPGLQGRRLARAEADLQDAHAPALAPTFHDTAAAHALRAGAAAEPLAYAWGLAYVVEGSQLGGAMLHRRLQARLAPHPLRYLQGDAAVGARWRTFMAELRAAVRTPAETAAAVRGAVAGFDALVGRFERMEVLA